MKKILVVEDESDLREEVRDFLRKEGYLVEEAADGLEGLEMVKIHKPDLILSDIKMPRMNGLTFLKECRMSNSTILTPFIFLTVKSEEKEIQEGLALGAQDYITKPFNMETLLERIKRHLEQLDYRQQLEKKNLELQVSYNKIKKLLEHKVQTVRMMTHDMRSPLTVVSGYAEMLGAKVEKLEWKKKLDAIHKSSLRIQTMINRLLRDYKSKRGKVDLGKCAVEVVENNRDNASLEEQDLFIECVEEGCIIVGDRDELIIAMDNLVGNGVRHTANEGEKKIRVSVKKNSDYIYFRVKDKGPGLTKEKIDKLLIEPLSGGDVDENRKAPHGFGIWITKSIAEDHDGQLLIESEPGEGATFSLKFPAV